MRVYDILHGLHRMAGDSGDLGDGAIRQRQPGYGGPP